MNESGPLLGLVLLERYRLARFIARGGMGEVYEALDQETGQRVAIKLLNEALSADEDWCARFRREAEVAMTIDSPYIARVLHSGKNRTGRRWIAFELLAGEPLEARLQRDGVVAFDSLVWMVDHALFALEAAHAVFVFHRDIKPANLFIENDPTRLRLLDFGIAKRVRKEMATSGLTNIDATLGSPSYMSPEQYLNPKGIDGRTDLYSLGLVVYRALTGALPYQHRDVNALHDLKRTRAVPPIVLRSGRGVAPALDAWVQHMAAPSRKDRFDTAIAARSAWRVVCDAVRRNDAEPVST